MTIASEGYLICATFETITEFEVTKNVSYRKWW